MKTPLLLLISLLATSASAQIIVNEPDMLVVNDTFRLLTPANFGSTDPSLTGTNYTWDFSFLEPESQDLDTAVSVGSTPFPYQYYFNNAFTYPNHKADWAVSGQSVNFSGFFTMTDVFDYSKTNSTSYQHLGFGATINSIPMSVRIDPIEKIYEFPMNYGLAFTNFSQYEFEIPTMMTYKQKKDKLAEVDGWGTVITPYGTFPCLRIKFTIDVTDSIYVDAIGIPFENTHTEIHYHWVTNGEDVPLLQVVETSGFVTSVLYKDVWQAIDGVEENSTSQIKLYPNPATGNVTISGKEIITEIQVKDLSGRVVYSQTANGTNSTNISINWPAGVYFISVKTGKGISTQKLVVK